MNKVNADLMFTNTLRPRALGVQRPGPRATGDKGSVFYQDADGFYTANVIDAVVEDGKATFTAMVTSSTISYAAQGDTFTWTVYDNGEGSNAAEADYFTFNSAMLATLVAWSTPARSARHDVPRHGGQHPDPLQRLIRPRSG